MMTLGELLAWLSDNEITLDTGVAKIASFPVEVADAISIHTSFLSSDTKMLVRVRVLLRGHLTVPLCHCGNDRSWQRQKKDFGQYCSVSCIKTDPNRREEWSEQARLSKDRLCEAVSKRKATQIEQHGSLAAAYAASADKAKETVRNRYGVDHIFQADIVKEKIKKTFDDRYGGHPLQSTPIMEKQIRTNMVRYGVANTLNLDRSRTNRRIVQERDGEDIAARAKQTREERYGGHHLAVAEILAKQTATNRARYGVDRPAQRHLSHSSIATYHSDEDFKKTFEEDGLAGILSIGYSRDRTITRAYHLGLLTPEVSQGEKSIGDFISSLGIEWKTDRQVIAPQELDIYIPDHNIAIEYCGVYWHSERFKHRDYHYEKLNRCLQHGVGLITIFEPEWIYRTDQVIGVLKSKLGVNAKLGARLTRVREIDKVTTALFLERFHIQGSPPVFSKAYGLFDREENIVAAMSFTRRNNHEWELSRYCSNGNIVGGAGKLLRAFCCGNEWQTIISFADRRYSEGNLYYQLGFGLDAVLPPDYGYVVRDRVEHKFNHRKIKYRDRHDIEAMTERQIMEAEGIYRIYDCGKLRFVLRANP